MRLPRAVLLAAGLAQGMLAQGMLAPGALAQPGAASRPAPLDIHVGDHGGFGRVVIAWPGKTAMPDLPQGTRVGDSLVIALPGAGAVTVPPNLAVRHVLGVQGGADQARLVLQPGSTTRIWRMGRRIVVDVFGAAPVPEVRPWPGAAAPGQPPAQPHAAPPPAPPAQAAAAAPAGPAPATAQAAAVQRSPEPPRQAEILPPPVESAGVPEDAAQPPPLLAGPESLRAARLPGPGDAILLPFDAHVGGAAFAAGGLGHAVFDDSKAIDLSGLKDDPVFGGARITLAPGTTHLSMAMRPGARLSLARRPAGWALRVENGEGMRQAAKLRLRDGTLTIGMAQAADMVVLVDPATGARRLVGTVRGHGDGVVVGHVSPEFRLLPSWEGVAVDVINDRLALKVTREGFALTTEAGPALSTLMLDSTQAALEGAGTLTRHFDIPPSGVAALRQRLVGDMAAAAHAPLRARFRPRLAAAQDMVGLGMGREAASLLDVARRDDPGQEARPEVKALLAMARWLAAGADEARVAGDEAIDAPGLGGSDEVALWRALMPPRGTAVPAVARAAVVAADWRLLGLYPAPLRQRLAPRAADILIEGRALAAAVALLDACAEPKLAAQRARLLAAQGKTAEALALLDGLAGGADRRDAAYALRDAVDMRLGAHLLPPEAAARALDKQLYAWRDPDFELARRLRIAALLLQAGRFRPALDGLRETERLFPEARDRVHDGQAQAIRALVRDGGAKLAPIDLLALVQDNADLLGQGDVAASLTPVLVDKLAALDLPARADRLVVKLIESTADAVPKAMLGARLAGLRLDQNDAAGALAALDQTMGEALPEEVESRRAVARARALAQLGEDGPALSLLAGHDDHESWELQARLREKSGDWHGAETALRKLARADVPAAGALNAAQQDLVLRLASAASQAGDGDTLRALADGAARRLSPGPRADLFNALTVQPVRDVADLPRAQRDASAAATLPAAWAGYAAH